MSNQTSKSGEEESTTLRSEEQQQQQQQQNKIAQGDSRFKNVATLTTSNSNSISGTVDLNNRITSGDLEQEGEIGQGEGQIHSVIGNSNRNNLLHHHQLSQLRQSPTKRPNNKLSLLSLRTTDTTDKSLSKSVKNLFVRASINFSLFLTRLKFIADEVLSSDEIENQIFYPSDSSSVLSELYEDHDDTEPMPVQNNMTAPQYPPDDIRNIDVEAKLKELRQELEDGQPFSEGDHLWDIQNQQWLIPCEDYQSMQGQLKLQKKMAEQELKHIVSTKDYSIVYNHLILKNKSLKKPMNLKDLLKVINAGWTVHKTWERAAQGLL